MAQQQVPQWFANLIGAYQPGEREVQYTRKYKRDAYASARQLGTLRRFYGESPEAYNTYLQQRKAKAKVSGAISRARRIAIIRDWYLGHPAINKGLKEIGAPPFERPSTRIAGENYLTGVPFQQKPTKSGLPPGSTKAAREAYRASLGQFYPTYEKRPKKLPTKYVNA